MNDILQECPLFMGISEQEIKDLFEKIHYQRKQYKSGELIENAGTSYTILRIVLKGSVKGEMMDYSGKVLKIEDIPAPKPLATAFLFGMNNLLPVDIIANRDTELLMLPKESVIMLMQLNKRFLQNFLNAISNRAQFLSDKLRFLSFKTIRGKLAHYLLGLAEGNNVEIVLPQSQEKIAELFAVTRPSLGRTMAEFKAQGYIAVKGRNVRILQAENLKVFV